MNIKFSSLFLWFGFDFGRSDGKSMRMKLCLVMLGLISFVIKMYFVITVLMTTIEYNSLQYKANKNPNLFIISYSLKTCFILISFIIFWIKFKKIKQILNQIQNHLNEKEKNSTRLCSILFLITWIIFSVGNSLLFFSLLLPYDWREALRELLWGIQGLGWLCATQLLTVQTCYGIYLIEKNTFHIYPNIKSLSSSTLDGFHQRILMIIKLKESFNQDLGHLPLL